MLRKIISVTMACTVFMSVTVIMSVAAPDYALADPAPIGQASERVAGFDGPDALFRYLERSDQILSRVTDTCMAITVSKEDSPPDTTTPFLKVTARCSIRNNPDGDSDCPALQFTGHASIDRPRQVTLRREEFVRLCSSEGR